MPGLAIKEASDPAELEEIALRMATEEALQRQKERFHDWHSWHQNYQKSGFGDDCYWTIGSKDPIPCDQELGDSAALTVELSTEQALEINQDNQVPNPAYFQELENQLQDILTDSSRIVHDVAANEDLDKNPKSSTRYILDEARFSHYWKCASWNGFSLPGQSDPLATCGKWMIWGCRNNYQHQDNQTYIQMIQKECCRSRCEMCVESWANREANAMTRRLTYWSQILKQNKSKLFNASHVVVSIPSRLYLKDMQTIKKEFRKIQKQVGINASAVILHPFRFATEKGDPYPSTHFHVIAFGWIQNTKEVYEKTGWLVHKISTLKNEVDYFRTSKYLLTHAGVKPATHAVVYTGNVRYSKLKLPEEETEAPQCPHCDLKLERLRLVPAYADKPPYLTRFAWMTFCSIRGGQKNCVETVRKECAGSASRLCRIQTMPPEGRVEGDC